MKYLLLLILVLSSTFAHSTWWQPAPGTKMHIQYAGTIDANLDVDAYNIDLEDTSQSKINQIKANNKKVICYFSAGSWENWRSDAAAFPASVKGNTMSGWPDEKWLDVRQLSILMPIMEARLDKAVNKGCDAVDPDNVDGWDGNNTGFPISKYDQMSYIAALSNAAHARGLAISMKNNPNLINYMSTYIDFAVIEQCHEYNECDAYLVMPQQGKAAFQIEYNRATTAFCPPSITRNFDAQKKYLKLNAWSDQCR